MASWHERYRRIIDQYRTALQEVDPAACRRVDILMARCGEGWIKAGGGDPVDPDRLMTAQDVAGELGYNSWDITNWSRRHPEKIPKYKQGTRILFRIGDVMAFQAAQGNSQKP